MTTSDQLSAISSEQPGRPTDPSAVDVAAGMSSLVLERAVSAARRARPVLGPLGALALHPPMVPRRLHPGRLIAPMAERGAARRRDLDHAISRLLDGLVPELLGKVLSRARLTELVLRYLDVDQVVAAVDLDRAADRLDIGRVLDRVDVAAVLDRVDVNSVVSRADIEAVLARIDLDDVVRRVDIDAVAQRLDLDALLDGTDVTALVLGHVDLDAFVEALLAHLDLVGLAEQVIDGVDLPEIIRESTGTMASDTVRGARMQGVAADEAVGRAVDRLLLRRGRRAAAAAVAGAAMSSPPVTVPPLQRRDTPS